MKPGLRAEIKAFRESSYQLIFHVVGGCPEVQPPGLRSLTLEIQDQLLVGAPIFCQPQGTEENRKKENKQNPKQMVKAKLNRKKHKETDSIRLRKEAKKKKGKEKKKERERKPKKQSNQINEESHK